MVGTYAEWLKNVKQLLRSRRPDVNPKLLDPNETFTAFKSGTAPIDFVLQPRLPLLPKQPPAATRKVSITTLIVGLCTILMVAALAFWTLVRTRAAANDVSRPPLPKADTAPQTPNMGPEERARQVANQVMNDYCAGGLDGFKRTKWWIPKIAEVESVMPAEARNPKVEEVILAKDGSGYAVSGLAEVLKEDGQWKTTYFGVVVDFNGNLVWMAFS